MSLFHSLLRAPARRFRWLALGALFSIPGAALAEIVKVEINKIEQRDSGCLFYLVSGNESATNFQELMLDMVLFDSEDLILRRIAINLAPMSAGKTNVKMFEIADTQCTTISKVLVNEILECRDDTGQIEGCLDLLSPGSRTAISLFL